MIKLGLRHQTAEWRTAISTDLRTAIQKEIDGLRASVDERVATLEHIATRHDEIFDQLTADVHAAAAEEAEAAAALARGEAEAKAESELNAVRARLQADLEAALTEFAAARAESEAVRMALEKQLKETESDIQAIRSSRDELATSLSEATKRIETLEEANAQTGRMRLVADARLGEEVQRRTMLTMQLDAARQEIVVAKAEADSSILEAHLSEERVKALEKRLVQLEAEAQRQPAPIQGSSDHVFERIKNGLDELRSVKTEELLSTLLDQVSDSFATVAIFAVKGKSLRLWKRRSGDATPVPAQVPFDSESPLARAAKYCTTVTEEATLGDGAAATPVNLMALPVLAQGRVMAVVFAQNPANHQIDGGRTAETIAEILVGCVNQRLSRNQSSIDIESSVESQRSTQSANASSSDRNQADQYAISRQARRVKVAGEVEVLIDGVTSTLIDLSALGAQIVSPTALRPNRAVRVALEGSSGRLTCEGRIVWAQLESSRAQTAAMYRAGVRFVDVNPGAITTLVSHYSPAEKLAVKSA
jgi:hypothetical protein